MATVGLIGTLDTKEDECRWLANPVKAAGCDTLVVDTGGFSADNGFADIDASQVASAAGYAIEELRERRVRGDMIDAMASGAAVIVPQLVADGTIDGVVGLGGSGGSSVAARAMQALPLGFPKLLVSTMASGDVRPYVGFVDTCLMYSVVDIAGLNYISEQVLDNAAAAIAGMARFQASNRTFARPPKDKLVGLTMFGLTTPAADEARRTLNELGYEVLVFHATGSGGRAMEKLVRDGALAGVLDLTTTEVADELVGGVLTAGPQRLEAAAQAGVPQVVSVGALDMVNFGPREAVPAAFADRRLTIHNPSVTLMRTTPEEANKIGIFIGEKLQRASGPTELVIPDRGLSGIDIEGGVFADAAANAALFDALETTLDESPVAVRRIDQHINDPGFGSQLATTLHRLIQSTSLGTVK